MFNKSAFANGSFQTGLSKREYFAGQALIGILSERHRVSPEDAAKYAYTVADAMIKEGNTETM